MAMSGLILALSFAMLAARQRSAMLGLAAAQASVLALTAVERGYYPEAAVLLLSNAAVLFWLHRTTHAVRPARPRIGAVWLLCVGGGLAGLAGPFGVPLAAVLQGMLFLAASRDRVLQVLALLAMQSGIALAGLDASATERMVAMVPIVPGLALAALVVLRRIAVRPPQRWRIWAEIGAAAVLPILVLSVPFDAIPGLRHDNAGVFAAILVALATAVPHPERAAGPRWFGVGGAMVAALAAEPVLVYAGLLLAAAASVLASSRTRVPLAGAALGLVLVGAVLPASSVASGCALLGLAALAVAAPALLPVIPMLALRYAGPELVALGLASVLACGAGAVLAATDKTRPIWLAFGQAGVVAALFGLHTADAVFAGLLLAVLLVLAQAVHALAKGEGLTPLLASAGLAGLPPLGVFPGLALAILTMARQAPWLLVGLLPGLAALGWAAIVRLPTPRIAPSDRWALAWIPLAAALLLGFCLPGPIADWMRALAREVSG